MSFITNLFRKKNVADAIATAEHESENGAGLSR